MALRDAVWGAAVGDALGVPYEFMIRDEFLCEDMVGFGTHYQPAGTWSDDTAMMLAICDSIRVLDHVDTADLLARFREWFYEGAYTPDRNVFDYGNATAQALTSGVGCSGPNQNGNGSLMRTAPLAYVDCTDEDIRAASAVTHAHHVSCDTCVEFVHLLRRLREDRDATLAELRAQYADRSRDSVRSGGFVVDTYDAARWCLATTSSYAECVLAAVNLGHDTDTTACVAGALAGEVYGINGIPAAWLSAMRGREVLEACLF